ncbi:MAG: serine/threonine protein kinase [Planctomycetes bacterium]|nr:serine/threonine protein kinase [Planctomycetota bacterium]
MSDSSWQALQEIFEKACELEAEERDGFLNVECNQDSALRNKVESLLAADSCERDVVSQIVGDAGRRAELEQQELDLEVARGLTGTSIGPYQLKELLGTGGMGAVYSAIRDDESYQKEVAIKVVREGRLSPASHSRFLLERQALAELDHPYIARLLDGGTSSQGKPYLVMEKVEGEPLDIWCDNNKLTVRQRLKLFKKIAEAVHDAHRKLIVHRDLKPANILVTADGTPKLLDFGVAKILDPAQEAVTRTERLLTPEYASPEQLSGSLVTTATDVYSLGVLLFELLTGRRPFQPSTTASHDLVRMVCNENPPAPSSCVPEGAEKSRGLSAERLKRVLAGDLDNMVMMALRVEPSRRYASAEQFAADVGRYLDGLPVIARKVTLRYRLAKFVNRNKVGVGSGVSVVLLLLVSVVVLNKLLEREQEHLAQSRLMSFSMLDMLRMDQNFGRDPRKQADLRLLLDRLTLAVDRLEETDPHTAADFLKQLGDSYSAIGLSPMEIYRRRLGILRNLDGIPENVIATALHDAGGVQDAYEMRLTFLQAPHIDLARSLTALADLAGEEARNDDSRELSNRANEMLDLLDPDNETLRARFVLATQASGIWHSLGDNPGALLWMDKALRAARMIVPVDHVLIGKAQNQRGWLLQDEQRFAEAEAALLESRQALDSALAPGHPEGAKLRHDLALLYKDTGRFAEAERLLLESEAILQAAYPDQHAPGSTEFSLARLRADEGRYAEAEIFA